jgi:GcrA cell cycle regulator
MILNIWTDGRVAMLKDIFPSGNSHSILARQINEQTGSSFSRNAVIGKCHRLGLERTIERTVKPRKSRPPRPARFLDRFTSVFELIEPPVPVDDDTIPLRQRRSFLELTDSTCRWPVGNVGERDFFFCGAVPFQDKPYCASHCAVAYQPTTDSKRRDLQRHVVYLAGRAA